MKKTTGVCAALLAISTLTLASGCQSTKTDFTQAQAFPSDVQDIANRAAEMGKPAIVVVDADWCTYCKQYKAGTLSNPDTLAFLNDNTVYEHVDFDEHKNQLRDVGVTALPTTLLFVDGRPKASFTGQKTSGDLIAWIEKNSG